MSIRALITEGIGPGGSVKYLLTLGLDLAAATAPNAPTIGTATAGNHQATVSFTESSSNGGSVITGHTATSSPGGLTGTSVGAGSGSIVVTGLTNGVSYTFTVHSTNAIGDSPESAASNAVTPAIPEVSTGKRPGPAPGSYPKKYFLPPGWKKKKPSIEEVKELYVEARKEIPPTEQRGLLPVRYRLEGHSSARLPPSRLVDFDALRSDLEALKGLVDALEARSQEAARIEFEAQEAEARRIKKRKREEEILIYLLLDIL